MSVAIAPVNPLEQPKMLAKVIAVQIKTKSPTVSQLESVKAYIQRQHDDGEDHESDSASQMVSLIGNSVFLNDSQKLSILTPVKDAFKSGDFSGLLEDEPERINPLDVPATPSLSAPAPAPVVVAPECHRDTTVTPPAPATGDDPASLMARAIQLLQSSAKPATAPLDEGRVTAIVNEVWSGKEDAITSNLTAIVEKSLGFAEARLKEAAKSAAHRIEIVHTDGKVIDIGDQPRHWQFEQILTWVSSGVPVWLWGKAGGGKTHLARQLAQALDLPATVVSIDPTMTVGKLVGYRNLATGEYVPGFLLAPYRDGGLLMLDEIDTGDPGIIACLNALLANGHYLFPNGETVERHKNFRVLAGANTKGTGAVAGYTARQKLDAATLNRFAIIELTYDERLEEILALGKSELGVKAWGKAEGGEEACQRWVQWVRTVRAKVGNSVLVSPRASYLGVAAIRARVPVREVADALVFALVSEDTKQSITHSCGNPCP